MKKRVKFLMLSLALLALMSAPVVVQGWGCEPDNQDYWCGYECYQHNSCQWDGSQSANDACVWTSYAPGACYNATNTPECGSNCEL